MSPSRLLHRVLAASLVAAGTLLLASGCQRSAASGSTSASVAEPPALPVLRVDAQSAPDRLPFTGRIEARQRVDVRARVSGPITAVHYEEGAVVAAGTPLFTIDPRPYQARRDEAAARLAGARAGARLADQELHRTRSLRAAAAVSVEELDRRTAEHAAAEAAIAVAAAALAAAELDLEFTVVRAPVAGRVGRAQLTPGNLATADATVLVTLVSTGPMRVRFFVDEPAFRRLRTAEGPVGVSVLPAGSETALSGTVDLLGNLVDPASGTAEVRATIDGPTDALAHGMFARIELLLPAGRASVLVPEVALGAAQGSRYVLAVGSDDTLALRRVTLGARVGDQRAVIAGLQPGETIVTAGLPFLRPGMKIRPLPAAPATAAAPVLTSALD